MASLEPPLLLHAAGDGDADAGELRATVVVECCCCCCSCSFRVAGGTRVFISGAEYCLRQILTKLDARTSVRPKLRGCNCSHHLPSDHTAQSPVTFPQSRAFSGELTSLRRLPFRRPATQRPVVWGTRGPVDGVRTCGWAGGVFFGTHLEEVTCNA